MTVELRRKNVAAVEAASSGGLAIDLNQLFGFMMQMMMVMMVMQLMTNMFAMMQRAMSGAGGGGGVV